MFKSPHHPYKHNLLRLEMPLRDIPDLIYTATKADEP
jgi:hypothetical protein